MKTILQKEAKILRKTAIEVPVKEIQSVRIKKIISEMKEILKFQEDGVAIAAPQIGYSFRIFIVSKKVPSIIKKSEGKIDDIFSDSVYINPVIKKVSKEKKMVEEGCLSVRFLYGKVKRGVKATMEAYDENGKKFTKGSTGLLAQIFQHEVDHLNGILFIDKAKNVKEIIPPSITNKK